MTKPLRIEILEYLQNNGAADKQIELKKYFHELLLTYEGRWALKNCLTSLHQDELIDSSGCNYRLMTAKLAGVLFDMGKISIYARITQTGIVALNEAVNNHLYQAAISTDQNRKTLNHYGDTSKILTRKEESSVTTQSGQEKWLIPNYTLFPRLHKLCADELMFKDPPISVNDFNTCFDLSSTPSTYPAFRRGGQIKFVYILSQFEMMNDAIAKKQFGIKAYKGQKRRSLNDNKPNQNFVNAVDRIINPKGDFVTIR